MANVTVQKQNDPSKSIAKPTIAEPHWEPFRMMRDMLRWDPFREMEALAPVLPPSGFAASFEVKETKDGYLFKADVPGMKESDVEVTVTGNRLTIAGKRDEEKREQTDTFYTYERSYGSFTRAFTLPDGVDMNTVKADLKDGVLSVTIAKTPEAQPKKIPVEPAAKKP